MLVKDILAALTFALVASATPLAERGACGNTCTGKDVQDKCSGDEKACCCDLVNLGVGVGCELLDLNVLILDQCGTNKKTCCCKQEAAVNVCVVVAL